MSNSCAPSASNITNHQPIGHSPEPAIVQSSVDRHWGLPQLIKRGVPRNVHQPGVSKAPPGVSQQRRREPAPIQEARCGWSLRGLATLRPGCERVCRASERTVSSLASGECQGVASVLADCNCPGATVRHSLPSQNDRADNLISFQHDLQLVQPQGVG